MTGSLPALRTKSGHAIHPVGIGTWGFGAYPLFSPGSDAEAAAIQYAISLGQNHIDTAEMYADGGAERVAGAAIALASREELFVASKLWKNHLANGAVRPAVTAMLRRLQTDYLDILYIHAPWFDAPWQEAIPQIDALIDDGIVRHFGVSNFNAARLQEALSIARHPIAADQIHYSIPHQQEVTPELRTICEANGIAIVAYMPLEKGAAMDNPRLQRISQKYGCTPVQVALAWLLATHAYPIPKASQRSHIRLNADAASLTLSAEDIRTITESPPARNS